MASTYQSRAELNAAALESFVYQPVSKQMIVYLATAAHNVIACDNALMPSDARKQQEAGLPTPPRTPEPRAVRSEDGMLPTLEEFITQLVVSSNVQVPTLMSTLVYLTRLKSRLQPMARGLRCTTHRIFLAALILSAKYLNDSSPKNKHWASYSHITTDAYAFGFSRTEVNLMEKQLLFLLDWELRITEEDLYRELEPFLLPIRERIVAKQARRELRRKLVEEEQRRQVEESYITAHYPTPERSREATPERTSTISAPLSCSPPGLTYSSGASSYTPSSGTSSRQHSRATTPVDDEAAEDPYMLVSKDCLWEDPVEVVVEVQPLGRRDGGKSMLPYEISAEELRELQEGGSKAKRARMGRGVWGRVFGSAVPVR